MLVAVERVLGMLNDATVLGIELLHVGMRHVARSPVPRLAEVNLAVVQERGHPRRGWQR